MCREILWVTASSEPGLVYFEDFESVSRVILLLHSKEASNVKIASITISVADSGLTIVSEPIEYSVIT